MQYIHAMKILELEVAGEYLVMAATLMAIKSQMLLPKQELIAEVEEYEEDPRDMLVAQLLEYRKFKYAAEQLSKKRKSAVCIIRKIRWMSMNTKRKKIS